MATQIIPYTDVIVQGGTTTICTLAFANTPVQKVQLPSNAFATISRTLFGINLT